MLNFFLAIALLQPADYFSRTIPNSMKRRYRYALNLLSLGLLVFALYLNFVRKEVVDNATPAANKNSTGKPDPANLQKTISLSSITLQKPLC